MTQEMLPVKIEITFKPHASANKNSNLFPLHTIKSWRGSKFIAALILSLCTIWSRAVSITSRLI